MASDKHSATVKGIIERYDLQPHVEGGYYRRTSEHPHRCEPAPDKKRSIATAILYLLPRGSVDRIHRLTSEEMWHFYSGGRMGLVLLKESGIEEIVLGPDPLVDVQQYKVPPNIWFGAYPLPESDYCFVGCTVSPGFDFEDLEVADRSALLAQFPESFHDLIHKLTPQ